MNTNQIVSKITDISPCALLAPYIRSYQLLELDTDHLDLFRPWYAIPEIYLIFFLADKPMVLKNDVADYHLGRSGDILVQCLTTHFNGLMKFNGNYSTFIIQFMPNGFNRLFRLPLKEFTDKLVDVGGIFGSQISKLREQLKTPTLDVIRMAEHADEFFSSYIIHQVDIDLTYLSDDIALVSGLMIQSECRIKIKQYAYEAHMSLRNFERKFIEQVGISPKLFCRSLRFNHAIHSKMINPEKSWIEIAY